MFSKIVKLVFKRAETQFQKAETRSQNAKSPLSRIFLARSWMDSAQKKALGERDKELSKKACRTGKQGTW